MNKQISKQRQIKSVSIPTEILNDLKRRSLNSIEQQYVQEMNELEDESDWEIFGILTGNNTAINELLFVCDGEEDVVIQESVQNLKRCCIPLDLK